MELYSSFLEVTPTLRNYYEDDSSVVYLPKALV